MVKLDLTYYNGKKVFITGYTGFKGTWLLCMLNRLGATVKGYALGPIGNNDLFYQIGGKKLFDSVIANILQKEKLEKEIFKFKPEVIFHLAAQPLVRLSYEIPAETFKVNVMGTLYLLEAV